MKGRRSIWIPYADAMAALALIFLLIIIFFAINQKETQALLDKEQKSDLLIAGLHNELKKSVGKVEEYDLLINNLYYRLNKSVDEEEDSGIVVPFSLLIVDLYEELDKSIANKYDEWGIRLLSDLTITFENPVVLFGQDSYLIKQEFKNILDEWAPVYFSIITKEKYRHIIKEVKIEGHTARKSPAYSSYIRTIELSQHRARSILDYIMQTSYFQALSLSEQKRLEYIVSANGFGYGRAIDDDYVPVIDSGNSISHKSRRVLFKIVIDNAEDVVNYVKGSSL